MEVPTISIDFSMLAGLIVSAFLDGTRELVSPLPAEFSDWLLKSIKEVQDALNQYNFLTQIPTRWTTEHADVMTLWKASLAAQAGLAALVLTIQGFRVVKGKADLFDTVFRTGFFVIAGLASVFWLHLIIGIVNALSAYIGFTPFTPGTNPSLIMGVLIIIAAIFGVLAWVKGAVGVVFIAMLIVVGPFMLTLSALPIFEGLGKWWVEELTTWMLRPFFVAVALRLGLGIGTLAPGPVEIVFAIVSFWLAWKMDTMLRRFSVGAWGSVGQMGLMAKGANYLRSGFGGASAPMAAAGAATGVGAVALAAGAAASD